MKNKSVTIIICKFGEGGVQFEAKSLIEILRSKDYGINLICDYSDIYDVKQFEEIAGAEVNLFPIKLQGLNIPLSFISLLFVFLKLKPKIFIVFSPKANTFSQVVAFLFFTKKRISIIDGFYKKQFISKNKNFIYIKLYELLLDLNYRLVTDIVVSSKSLMNELPIHVKKKSKVIYGFLPDKKVIDRCETKIPFDRQNHFIIIYNGRLGPEKGVHYLVESFSQLSKLYGEFRLIILGDNNNQYAQNLASRILELGIHEKVFFTGYVENVSDYLKFAKVLILPSITESFGYAILEAWRSKIPVIASNIEGPAEIIEDEVDGLLFKMGSIDDLIKKIEIIYFDKEKALFLAKNGYNKLSNNFSKDRFFEKWNQILIHD